MIQKEEKMGIDIDLATVLRDVIQFLECLQDVKLPVTLENIRNNLLVRSKAGLTNFSNEEIRSASPEAYLNMNPRKKCFPDDTEEYVEAEEPQKDTQQDYYETFQSETNPQNNSVDDKTENAIYKSYSAAQAKAKSLKCGSLYKKEGKKLFVFEQYRACWVGLVGSHLLIYGSEKDTRPYFIQPLRGFMGRPAPNAIPRDQKRSESAFEIFCPGNKTLQFIARTPNEMEQWVAKVCEIGSHKEEPTSAKFRSFTETEIVCKVQDEQYQDAGALDTERTKEISSDTTEAEKDVKEQENSHEKDNSSSSGTNPPPLPSRTPRKLPSLPPEGSSISYERMEDEEDEIYYKIEDYKNESYQNLIPVSKKLRKAQSVAYDDVSVKKQHEEIREETYDDVEATVKNLSSRKDSKSEDSTTSYDDVKNSPMKSGKSPQKKSFLERVRSRRESPKKDKKEKQKFEEQPTYDDISNQEPNVKPQETIIEQTEQPEYNCPPPPRPIYGKLEENSKEGCSEELYDDVSECREKASKQGNQKCFLQSCEMNTGKESCEETEHYQTPKRILAQEEELYDDIAILTDFTSRQRELNRQNLDDPDDDSKLPSPERKPWSRFVRKSRISDPESNKIDSDDINESQGLIRMNTFQKLISKMENSLGKSSLRNTSLNKSNESNAS